MSMMKTSGSKRERVINDSYSDERDKKKSSDLEDLPERESIKTTQQFYNGKVNFGPLVRFLRSSVGKDWNNVHSEIISRIPTKMLDYKDAIFWFVADRVDIREGKLWNRENRKYIWREEDSEFLNTLKHPDFPDWKEFYVDPETNTLKQIPQKSLKRIYKK